MIKHGVSFDKAITVFDDTFAEFYEDNMHSDEVERYIVNGYSSKSNLLVVSFTYRNKNIRIISSRNATKKEK